jgi:hypothetical protein
MRPRATLLGTLIALSACAGPQDPGVLQDLRKESAANGLALMEMSFQNPVVIPFDSEERHLDLPRSGGIPWAVSNSGRMIAWYREPSAMDILGAPHAPDPITALQSELVIRTTEGRVVARRRFLGGITPRALNEEARRLALISGSSPEYPRGGTYWQSLDFSSGGLVDDSIALAAEWSPDGALLAYQTAGEIRLFDIAKGSSRSLTNGTLQTWSPNGKWIAFHSPDRWASLVTPEGAPVKWSLSQHRIDCCLTWSPDGRFVSFEEYLEIPLLTAYHRPVVCRVTDGACTTMSEVPVGLRWIVNYRSLLSGLAATESPIDKK